MFFLSGKKTSCDYSPNSRVIKNINSKNIHYSSELHSAFSKNQITVLRIQNIIKYGDVNFSKSQTKLDSCKIYVIETRIDEINYSVQLENCANEVKILTYTLE
tara:strand:- start:297 stop:605 length:309 start_codon:yes stop_codon:yes gene_type:complete